MTGRITPDLRTFLVASMAPGLLTLAVLWLIPSHSPDRYAHAMRGFSNMWAAGRAAGSGHLALLLDRDAYASWVRSLLGADMPRQVWGYPPAFLLAALPLSLFPLGIGFAAWTLGGMGTLLAAMRRAGLNGRVLAASALSPPVLAGALSGQTGALTASAMVFGLVALEGSPVAAGTCMGVFVAKPQLGLLLPVCLVASRNWKAMAAAILSASAIVTVSGLAFGWDAWSGFFLRTSPTMAAILQAPWTGAPEQSNVVSPFMAARAAGAPLDVAWGLQGLVAAACATAAWRAWSRPTSAPGARLALTCCLSLLATPYVHDYDMVVVAPCCALLAVGASEGGWFRGERGFLALTWAWPGAAVLASAAVPGAASVAAGLACAGVAGTAACAARRTRELVDGRGGAG
jgi:hypothetical protein